MRSVFNVCALLVLFSAYSQRVVFQDPGFTFSIKSPNNWQLIDDGYEIIIAPKMSDTSNTYLSITYFDPPEQQVIEEGVDNYFSVISAVSKHTEAFENVPYSSEYIKIAKQKVFPKILKVTEDEVLIEKRFYEFEYQKRNWEIILSAPEDIFSVLYKKYERIIKSIKAKGKTGELE